jgi:hypothetical protein
MPTILRIDGFRFHFYSEEGNEPAHIHIRYEGNECKFWLDPVLLASNRGIPAHRISDIESLVFENKELLINKYNEHRSRQS